MSKKQPKRNHAKRSNESKRATGTPESQRIKPISPEEYERGYNRNARKLCWGIAAIVFVLLVVYILIGIDVSGCYLAFSEDPTIECTPYSLLEYLTNAEVVQQAQNQFAESDASTESAESTESTESESNTNQENE